MQCNANKLAPPNKTSLSCSFAGVAVANSNARNSIPTTSPISVAAAAAHNNADNGRQQTRKARKASGAQVAGNRWTHFGARLKPLGGAGDHQSAASSPALSAPSRQVVAAFANSNKLDSGDKDSVAGDSGAAAANEEDDDEDDEALLYKMMQQQHFLLNPNFGAERPAAAARQLQRQQPQQPQAAQQDANSKRVIKLLKSYSHIHQVDDSDDQIRGTYTRVPARRQPPPTTAASR